MLPRYTYAMVFRHRDGEHEEVEHINEQSALEHFNMFTDEDGDIYELIYINRRDWKTDRDECIAQKEF